MRFSSLRLSLLAALTSLAGCAGDSGATVGYVDASRFDAGPRDAAADEDGGSSDLDGAVVPRDAAADAPRADAGPPPPGPDEAGPYTPANVTSTVMRGDREIPVVAYLPSLPGGERAPLLVFVPGFQLDSSRYTALCERIASHGVIVVRADPPDPLIGVSHVEMEADVDAVLDWALDPSGALSGRVDSSHVGLAGHSLGGKVVTMAASGRRVHALLALDPVNTGSPITGYSDALPDILPDEAAELRIPVGFMGETTNGGGISPCAPEDENFARFYADATSSPWAAAWEIEGADHIDFVDDTSGICTACTACPDGPADDAAVRGIVRTLAVAFVRRHLRGELAMEEWLTGSLVPDGVRVMSRP